MTSPQENPKKEPEQPTSKAPATGAKNAAAGSDASPQKPAGQTSERRPPGAKEVIPFEWKLIGEANGLALTLFKAIEREDVEAQQERVSREGYYRNLRILGNTEKVKQPVSATPKKTARKRAATTKATKVKKDAAKSAKAPRTVKAGAASKTKRKAKAARTSVAKTGRKKVKKTTVARKATVKKGAKKKTSRRSRR